ncbi:unnamed protein product [Lampetra planeri]
MSEDEKVFLQNIPAEEHLEINFGNVREAAAVLVVTVEGQLQQPEHLLNQALLMTQGWEWLEGQIDRLTYAVPQLVMQLARREERLGAAVMVAGEPAARVVRPTAAEVGEPETSGAVVMASAPSPEIAPVARERADDRPRRLGPVKEFVAAGGDWGAFIRWFEAAYQASDWSKAEVLKALPTALDDEALAIFKAILLEWRTTLQAACHEMAEIFDPPSNAKIKCQQRKREEAELPLFNRSALIALSQAAYSRLDEPVLDSLAMENMLSLVHEMTVVLLKVEEEAQTSLWVAQCLQTQEQMNQWTWVAPERRGSWKRLPAPPAQVAGRAVLSAGAHSFWRQWRAAWSTRGGGGGSLRVDGVRHV